MIGKIDQSPFDVWTILHTAVGVGAGACRMNPWLYTGSIIAYEVIENAAEGTFRESIFGASKPESQLNIVADLGVGLLGYVVGRWLRDRGTTAMSGVHGRGGAGRCGAGRPGINRRFR